MNFLHKSLNKWLLSLLILPMGERSKFLKSLKYLNLLDAYKNWKIKQDLPLKKGRWSLVEISSTTNSLRGFTEMTQQLSLENSSVFRVLVKMLHYLDKATSWLDLLWRIIRTGHGRVGVKPLKEFVVDEISTKLHLPFFKGKSCLIFQFHLPHNSLMGLTEILEKILILHKIKINNK